MRDGKGTVPTSWDMKLVAMPFELSPRSGKFALRFNREQPTVHHVYDLFFAEGSIVDVEVINVELRSVITRFTDVKFLCPLCMSRRNGLFINDFTINVKFEGVTLFDTTNVVPVSGVKFITFALGPNTEAALVTRIESVVDV